MRDSVAARSRGGRGFRPGRREVRDLWTGFFVVVVIAAAVRRVVEILIRSA